VPVVLNISPFHCRLRKPIINDILTGTYKDISYIQYTWA